MKNLLEEVQKITDGERFISLEQLEEIEQIPYIYVENCGTSGTGRGIWYNIYESDQDGNRTEEKICEVVVED